MPVQLREIGLIWDDDFAGQRMTFKVGQGVFEGPIGRPGQAAGAAEPTGQRANGDEPTS